MFSYYGHWQTLHKFDDHICKRNENVILNLSKFIYFSFKSRQLHVRHVLLQKCIAIFL